MKRIIRESDRDRLKKKKRRSEIQKGQVKRQVVKRQKRQVKRQEVKIRQKSEQKLERQRLKTEKQRLKTEKLKQKKISQTYPMELNEYETIIFPFENWQKNLNEQKNKYIFLHIPRTGGTSLLRLLKGKQLTHWSAAVIRDRLGDDRYNECRKFSVVRNSWDRLVSLFTFMRLYNGTLRFDYFIRNIEAYFWTISQLYFICDGSVSCDTSRFLDRTSWEPEDQYGKIIVDDILKFENLSADVIKVDLGPLNIKLNQTRHKHYSHYYTNETRKIVQYKYWDEIQRFDFVFEDRKNICE